VPVQTEHSAPALTGDHAVLYSRAKTPLPEMLQNLRDLQPLRPDADPEATATTSAVMVALLRELVDELGHEVLVAARVEHLLKQLEEQLDAIKDVFGFERSHVQAMKDEIEYTKWLNLDYFVRGLRAAFEEFKAQPTGAEPFLGDQIGQMNRALDAVREAVAETENCLARASIGYNEQQVVTIEYADGRAPIPIGALLGWARHWAEREARIVLSQGGRAGVRATAGTAATLQALVAGALDARVSHNGFQRPRVRRAFEDLAQNLGEVVNQAGAAKSAARTAKAASAR
jgi:hypothetical protein